MKINFATRITITVVAILLLVMASSVLSVLSTLRSRSTVLALKPILFSTVAAEELEIALLEQRGVVASYILEGGSSLRLEDLRKPQQAFDDWLVKAREFSGVPEQTELLGELDTVYDRYMTSRAEVVRLYDSGHHTDAIHLLLDDVQKLYQEAYVLCEKVISNNERFTEQTSVQFDRSTQHELGWVATISLVSILLALCLLGQFFFSILKPLRVIVAELHGFQFEPSGMALRLPNDEMRAVGFYLRRLMSDVAEARTSLAEQRARMVQTENLAMVGKLAACVAHEIRNPLTAIKMWIFSAHESLPAQATQLVTLDKVSREIERLEHVVQHFLEFARPPQLHRMQVSVGQLIARSLEIVEPALIEKELSLSIDCPEPSPESRVDSEQITQVLSNLLFNAVDASLPGAAIAVEVQCVTLGDGIWHVIRVRDQASGIDEEGRQRIFEPFFTTKGQGTGLGLCIAANIMARHGGRVQLDHSDSSGTVFSVWLPPTAVSDQHGTSIDH